MLTRRQTLLLGALAAAQLAWPALARDTAELAANNPVGILSMVSGQTEIKRPDGDWQPAYWLTLVRPEDLLRTGGNGKILVDFFSDDHLEVVDASSEAKVAFKNLERVTGTVRREGARDRAVVEIPIPYMLERKLYGKDFEAAQEPGALEREKIFLGASVRPDAYPPVFQWTRVPAPQYRLQLFNEWDEVIYETRTANNRFKYPYSAPFQLARNSQYLWQVVTPDDRILVRKYPFTLLTLLHARELQRSENQFEKLKKQKKLMPYHYTELFLLYNKRKMIDRTLSLLRQMSNMDPENPMIYRALVRAYLAKGCPAHAQEALTRELRLNGVDPLHD